MKTFISCIFTIIPSFYVMCQNLVPNNSFEQFSALPNDDCDWALAEGWGNAASTSFCNASNGTPDYYHVQGVGFFSALPENFFATILPLDGDAIMGVVGYFSFSSNDREYASIQLTQALEIGELYRLEYSLTPGEPTQGGFAIDGWGIALSVNPLLQQAETNSLITTTSPTFLLPEVIADVNWQTFSFEFVADSAYNHLTLGNFKTDAGLVIQTVGTPATISFAYSFFDQIILEPYINVLPINLLYFKAQAEADQTVHLSWATQSEVDNALFTVERSHDAYAWEVLLKMPGAGYSTQQLTYSSKDQNPFASGTYYRLKQTDFDGVYRYSNVKYIGRIFFDHSDVLFYPNPIEDLATIKVESEGNFEWEIIDSTGKNIGSLIRVVEISNDAVKIDVSLLSSGVYLFHSGSSSQRFVKL